MQALTFFQTLRKSASDQEKEEFLKEALLMSNFRHAHILSLLGVCLDNDPQFIILELMEGGDLLSFMRACRLSSVSYWSYLLLLTVCTCTSNIQPLWIPYHTFPKHWMSIWPVDGMSKMRWLNVKQCRPWSVCSVWYGSTLFAPVYTNVKVLG